MAYKKFGLAIGLDEQCVFLASTLFFPQPQSTSRTRFHHHSPSLSIYTSYVVPVHFPLLSQSCKLIARAFPTIINIYNSKDARLDPLYPGFLRGCRLCAEQQDQHPCWCFHIKCRSWAAHDNHLDRSIEQYSYHQAAASPNHTD